MTENSGTGISRRRLLTMIGQTAGGTAMYQAMHSLGLAAESPFEAPIRLSAAPKGASVLVLGAGIAGLVAAYELRNAGYKVQVLEYNERAGGRKIDRGELRHRAEVPTTRCRADTRCLQGTGGQRHLENGDAERRAYQGQMVGAVW